MIAIRNGDAVDKCDVGRTSYIWQSQNHADGKGYVVLAEGRDLIARRGADQSDLFIYKTGTQAESSYVR